MKKDKMKRLSKITILPNGKVQINVSKKDKNYENDILEYATKLSYKISHRVKEGLKIKVKIVNGKVSRVKPYEYDGRALRFVMESK